jgi:hypothetical protein
MAEANLPSASIGMKLYQKSLPTIINTCSGFQLAQFELALKRELIRRPAHYSCMVARLAQL